MSADTLFTVDTDGRYRPSDPWTSKAAARSAGLRAGTARYRILEDLIVAGGYGRTAYELGARLGLLAHVAGTRLGELIDAGYATARIVPGDTGPEILRRPTDTGRTAVVHVITSDGIAAMDDLGAAMAARTADVPPVTSSRPPGRPTTARRPSARGITSVIGHLLEVVADATALPHLAGLTAVEAAGAVGVLRNTAGTYLKTLEDAGLVRRTGRTRPTDRGHAAGVYAVTDTGRLELERLTTP